MSDNCIFCKIVNGTIPSFKIFETDRILAFLDAFPVSKGHFLVIPKEHHEKFHNVPTDLLADMMGAGHKIVNALNLQEYNVAMNNGSKAGQMVPHAHMHFIPKTDESGVELIFNQTKLEAEAGQELAASIKAKLQ
ncbi:hit family protein 1 [Carpediemonas membranifera]|uniref:Hit family protein 1 n=1 Tax=Carpediemonas membranifera TaxID=201153 RepID=A0A8J6AWC1_9EUKA|nr:hit family protein 1 [Carpediemonas membranifera]|eukprot:KAG9394130.1 hit family protein 1 [Carpediemonas membranifera]